MIPFSRSTSHTLRRLCRLRILRSHWRKSLCQSTSRCITTSIPKLSSALEDITNEGTSSNAFKGSFWDIYRDSYLEYSMPRLEFCEEVPDSIIGENVQCVGYLKHLVVLGPSLIFARMSTPTSTLEVQLLSRDPEVCSQLRSIEIESPIYVCGTWRMKREPKKSKRSNESVKFPAMEGYKYLSQVEIETSQIICLNTFPTELNKPGKHPPERRHLQIRFDTELKKRLLFRSSVANYVRTHLQQHGFSEFETPILFKSTPEGAKEFLVPSRKPGYAYALPQSPQQYKQILVASGIDKYFQFAKCFRDEDLRADRQPEFTQIDLEMAFADGETVKKVIEKLIIGIYKHFSKFTRPVLRDPPVLFQPLLREAFPSMQYSLAISKHGSDKPDLRIKGLINCVDSIISDELRGMLTPLKDSTIEVCKFRLNSSPEVVRDFVHKFMESKESEPFRTNPDGAPGFAIYDSKKPMSGLQIFGFQGSASLQGLLAQQAPIHLQDQEAYEIDRELEDGDLLVIQARKNEPLSGGSTTLGKLRTTIHKAAVEERLLEHDPRHHYLWVTDFPMFTPENGSDPGQGGKAGFSATHHPFTAPKSRADIDLLQTNPLAAVADHYDLVVNGVELGGGSRRIHNAMVQKYVMKDVLKMSDERINDFSHLFAALGAGCPPHSGIALGFDRLIAILTGQDSVKDVIAFPKSSKGDDLMVRSPSLISDTELERYHLQFSRAISRRGTERLDLD